MKRFITMFLAISVIVFLQVLKVGESSTSNDAIFSGGIGVRQDASIGEGWSAIQKEVWEKTVEWWSLRIASNWEETMDIYRKDAVIWHYYHRLPLDKFEYKESSEHRRFTGVDLEAHEVKIIGNIAIVMFSYVVSSWKRMIFIWMKQNSDWKLIGSVNFLV